jgi:hypothetical protein
MSVSRWQLARACSPVGQRNAGMRPHGVEQYGDGLANRAVVAPDVKLPQESESVDDIARGRI